MTKKTYVIIAAVIAVLVAGFIWWNTMRVEQEPTGTAQPVDTTEAIQQDLAGIEVGDVTSQFKDVDQALQGL